MVAGASQKLDVDEHREHRLRGDQVKAPQPLNLPLGQRQTWNLEILGAYELDPIGDVRVSRQHWEPYRFEGVSYPSLNVSSPVTSGTKAARNPTVDRSIYVSTRS